MNLSPNYQNILRDLKEKIRKAKLQASLSANVHLIAVYWEIGVTISQQETVEGWGAKTILKLSKDLREEFPDMKGFSERNLRYMRDFALAYPGAPFLQQSVAEIQDTEKQIDVILQPLVAKLPWGHHTVILDRVKSKEERQFYMQKTIENAWSKSVLAIQIENGLYQRQGKAITNFSSTLPSPDSDLAQETIKNPYLFDFISFGEKIQERELEKALIKHLKEFMLELGKGFAYVGNQFNINVDGNDFYLDLLFFNFHLNCFVIFELKVGEFKPEFVGKLNFYVNSIDAQIKDKSHKPTIGVLLCKTPNETVVGYSLQGIDKPIGVADYQLAKALPKELKSEIPTIEELEAEIEKEYEELKSPSQKRFESLKEKLTQLKGKEIKQAATTPVLYEIVDKSLIPLYKVLIERMEAFNDLFVSSSYTWQGKNKVFTEVAQVETEWKNEEFLKSNFELYFSYRMEGFKKAGTEAFSMGFQLNWRIDTYWYGFSLVNYNNQQPIVKKLYHEQLSKEDIEIVVEVASNFVMDDMERQLEHLKKE